MLADTRGVSPCLSVAQHLGRFIRVILLLSSSIPPLTVLKYRTNSPALSFFRLCCGAFLLSTIACSANRSDSSSNNVGQYDPEFDPAPSKTAEAEALPNLDEEIELLNEATKAYDGGLYSLAQKSFTSLQEKYPSSYYSAFAELKAADAQFQLANYTEALESYQDFLRLRPKHEAVPYVMFQVAETYRLQYRGPANDQSPLRTAIKHYQSLIELYPTNSFSALARRGIVASREQLALHESAVARFYLRQGQKRSAAHRFKRLIGIYADTAPGRMAESAVRVYFKDDPELLSYINSKQLPNAEPEKLKEYQPSIPQGVSLTQANESIPALLTANLPSVKAKEESELPSKRQAQEQGETEGQSLNSEKVADAVGSLLTKASKQAPLHKSLSCDTSSGLSYLSLELLRPVNYSVRPLKNTETPYGVEVLLSESNAAPSSTNTTVQKLDSCRSNHLSVELEQSATSELRLKVVHNTAFEYKVLSLDRPQRFLFVLVPKS